MPPPDRCLTSRMPFATHEVANQVPPFEGRNLFDDNAPLVEALEREGGGWARERAREVGAVWGGDPITWGFEANENPPRLKTFDRYGNRIDEVEFHRAWHDLMTLAVRHELHSLPWTSGSDGAHVARTAMYLTAAQAEGGFACPITMTFAAVPALRAQPEIAAQWEPRLTATTYDPVLRPAGEKASALCGMAMTEKQGGSDVRANTTIARPARRRRGVRADRAQVVLLGADVRPVPRPRPGAGRDLLLRAAADPARRHAQRLPPPAAEGQARQPLQRLKRDRAARRLGAARRRARPRRADDHRDGRPHAPGLHDRQRRGHALGVANATWHAAHRSAFGKRLADQPLMRNVLADLAIESEAATALAMRVARAYDETEFDERARHLRRLATAIGKYWVCKRGPGHAFEALECLGGNGYVEESGMPRLYREMPLSSIWEGSGNVMALDVLRALSRSSEVLTAFLDEVGEAAGADARLDAFTAKLRDEFADPEAIELRARRVVEHMALALQASLLVRHAPPAVADAFCASRLAGDGGLQYGTLPAGADVEAIVERHTPPPG